MSSGYSGRTWKCPYFRWDKRHEIHCQAGRVSLPKEAYREYVKAHCAGRWEECSLARALSAQEDK